MMCSDLIIYKYMYCIEQESEYIFKVYAINEGGNSAETMATAKTFSGLL